MALLCHFYFICYSFIIIIYISYLSIYIIYIQQSIIIIYLIYHLSILYLSIIIYHLSSFNHPSNIPLFIFLIYISICLWTIYMSSSYIYFISLYIYNLSIMYVHIYLFSNKHILFSVYTIVPAIYLSIISLGKIIDNLSSWVQFYVNLQVNYDKHIQNPWNYHYFWGNALGMRNECIQSIQLRSEGLRDPIWRKCSYGSQ